DQLQRAIQDALVVAAVVNRASPVCIRELVRPDEVPLANLDRVQTQRTAHFLDGPLGNERGLRSARSTVGSGWTGGGQDADAFGAIGIDLVRAGGMGGAWQRRSCARWRRET